MHSARPAGARRTGMTAAVGLVILALAHDVVGRAAHPPAAGAPVSLDIAVDCAGDCNGNRAVSIDELITGIAIALGTVPLAQCPAVDRDGDGTVSTSELIAAVTVALDGCPIAPPTPTRTATPVPTDHPPTPTPGTTVYICSSLADPLDIPDGEPLGVVSVLAVADPRPLDRLQVTVWIDHPWVGDLEVSLSRLDDPATALLVDRPGYPDSPFGCNASDIICQFTDASATPAESQCEPAVAALRGALRPAEPLAVFAGGALAGQWQLRVIDRVAGDAGRLVQWCLAPE